MEEFIISNPQEIYKGDFEDMLKKGDFEVFSKSQIDTYLNDLGSVLEKSEYSDLDENDREAIDIAKAEVASFSKFTVLDDEFNKSLKYVRHRQIEWDKGESEEIMKGISGTYLNTNLNRKLERVGEKFEKSIKEDI